MTTLPEEAVKAAMIAQEKSFIDGYDPDIQMKAALTAALPFLSLQVAVKKLEWIEIPACNGLNTARTEFGTYTIGSSLVARYGLKSISKPLATLEVAKAAAQADYEARILSALEPSAARELALEEHLHAIEQQLAVNLEYFHDEKRILLETLQSHIISHISAIRALSSPDHADAGKVEGDVEKWSIREIVAKAIAYHSVGDPHAKTIRGDQRWEWFVEEADKFISVFGYYLPAIPSAPASEGAE